MICFCIGQGDSASASTSSTNGNGVTEEDLATHAERTEFYLRMAEVVRARSDPQHTQLVVMTLPLPKKRPAPVPSALYMAWLDFVSRGTGAADMPPFLFVRGNQESVLTFYS